MCYKVSFIGCGPTASAPATATGRSRRVRNNCGAHIHGVFVSPPSPPSSQPPQPPAHSVQTDRFRCGV